MYKKGIVMFLGIIVCKLQAVFSVPFIKVQLLLPWDEQYYFKSIFLETGLFRKVLFEMQSGNLVSAY